MLSNKFYKILFTAGIIPAVCFLVPIALSAQIKWVNVDAEFGPLPATVQVFKTTNSLNGKPFISYYVKAKLKDKKLNFSVDTTLGRRLTPLQFYDKNERPLVVVNCTFFNFDKHQNLNVVIKEGKMLGYNVHTIPMRGKDTFLYRHPVGSAIGIDKNRNADVAWLLTDSLKRFGYAYQTAPEKVLKDSILKPSLKYIDDNIGYNYDVVATRDKPIFKKLDLHKWKMRTAVGGGPVLVQHGKVKITNAQELKFTGNAINDKHPRTSMGYTSDGYLIIMAIQGRFPGMADGATLEQEAQLLVDLGCVEALNLDGGGSSCLLVNGKETIRPSDKAGQRAVPAVFIIKTSSF